MNTNFKKYFKRFDLAITFYWPRPAASDLKTAFQERNRGPSPKSSLMLLNGGSDIQ